MSWDIYIQDLPPVASIADIPADFRPQPIGERASMIARIMEAVPFAELQDDSYLFVRTDEIDLSISFSLDPDTQRLMSIAVHVHGGERSPACVAAIVRSTGLRALDTGTSEFFDADAPEHGFALWAEYRDRVLRQH